VIVADTGPLVAAADRRDAHHSACAEVLAAVDEPLIVPAPVVIEVCWLLARAGGAAVEAAFLQAIHRGEVTVEPLASSDYKRIAELVEAYGDLPLGMVDASVVAVAERLDVRTVMTLNRRDFTVVRPRHVVSFNLIPAL
jgi:uncharacterized protein